MPMCWCRVSFWGTVELVAPTVIREECSRVILVRGRALEWGSSRIVAAAEVINTVPVKLFKSTNTVPDLVRFALQHNVQGMDALYLALAMRSGASLATFDRGLKSAAVRAGVPLFVPA